MTQKLRRQLEAKTQELAPVKQERAVLQAALDTAETELKILEDSTNRAKQRLSEAEKELASLDDNEDSKREALNLNQDELKNAKESISNLKSEDKELSGKEENLGRHHKDLLVSFENTLEHVICVLSTTQI